MLWLAPIHSLFSFRSIYIHTYSTNKELIPYCHNLLRWLCLYFHSNTNQIKLNYNLIGFVFEWILCRLAQTLNNGWSLAKYSKHEYDLKLEIKIWLNCNIFRWILIKLSESTSINKQSQMLFKLRLNYWFEFIGRINCIGTNHNNLFQWPLAEWFISQIDWNKNLLIEFW